MPFVIREDYVRERLLNDIAGCIRRVVPEDMLDSRLKQFAVRLQEHFHRRYFMLGITYLFRKK